MDNLEYFNHFLALTERAIEEGIKDSLEKQEQERDNAA